MPRLPRRCELIVVEGNGEVVEEQECLVFIGPQPVEQVAHGALPAPPAASLALFLR